MLYKNALELIGNTPLLELSNLKKKYNLKANIFAKLESYNLTGSIKDRASLKMILDFEKENKIKEGYTLIEATSGNTGIALAALGRFYKYPVYIFMPDWVSKERIDLIKNYGAKIILFSKEEGGFIRCVEEAKKMGNEKNAFLANQFASKDNFLAHYETTALEIIKQLPEETAGFISGVGTGGTLMGTGKRLKEEFENLQIIALEPDKMPIISQGKVIAQHKIEGIGDDFVPDLVDRDAIDDIILVNDDDAINMSRKLARELGLGVGISSGANLIGCVLANDKINKPVVTVFADDNKKYLSTDLAKDIDENQSFISNQIKLINYEII